LSWIDARKTGMNFAYSYSRHLDTVHIDPHAVASVRETERRPAFAGWTAPGRSPEGFGKAGQQPTKATWPRHRAKEGWPTMQSAIVERAQ
jgi:hypothetical protein